ncbi:DHHW family protein [Clostridium chauvoei]|uniref:DHHW family protein n=1 Tax=Clostridium chauvoei TaxID=46867 RepID=UPI0021A75BB6|nr:DHHW family protein [Clostridium chauvoei]
MLNRIFKYPLVLFFILIIVSLTIFDLIEPIKYFSEVENRSLSKKPGFTLYNLFYNDYFNEYNKYINDQFIFRDYWIDLKSRIEYTLGKYENNGIVYTKDNFMFEKYQNLNEDRLISNLEIIDNFLGDFKIKSTLMIIPNSYAIYSEQIPVGLKLVDQKEIINQINGYYKNYINIPDLITPLIKNKDNYIYYKTDHHWTSYGAYIAYCEYIKSLQLKPIDVDNLTQNTVADFYGSYFSKAKLFNASSDTITYFKNDNLDILIDGKSYKGLHDLNKFDKRDKYSAFLRGNNGLTIIKNNDISNDRKKTKLLVIKDSYANCFIDFLIYNFEEIYVIDLRSYNKKLSEFMRENSFTDILIMYNFINIADDVNISKLKY